MKISYRPQNFIEGALEEVKMIKSSRLQKIMIGAIAGYYNASFLFASAASTGEELPPEDPITKLKNEAIHYAQLAGMVIAIAMCLFEISKAMLDSDPKKIPGIVSKYAIGVLAVYGVPLLYEGIGAAFGAK